MQASAYTSGKNATDIAIVIDAMDLLHSGRFDGFCLVSSDSDFTGLAIRLRASGMTVYGFGETKTPTAFVAACDTFLYIESPQSGTAAAAQVWSLPRQSAASTSRTHPATPDCGGTLKVARSGGTPEPAAAAPASKSTASAATKETVTKGANATSVATTAAKRVAKPISTPPARAAAAALKSNTVLVSRLRQAVAAAAGQDGWASLSAVGTVLSKSPRVSASTHGYAKLSDFLAATTLFDLEQRSVGKNKGKAMCVRDKRHPRT